MHRLDRRAFLRSAALGTSSIWLSACGALSRPGEQLPRPSATPLGEGGYGPLQVAGDELALAEGFQYVKFGVEGSEMSDGTPTPRAHDGMAAFPLPNGNVRLVRNHEDSEAADTARPRAWPAYDGRAGGGTTSLEIDPHERTLVRDFNSLNGTLVNCAGGPTPWGSWLSCEEITWGTERGYEREHGYVFEVPAAAEGPVDPVPIPHMGRFKHEAVAVEPATGTIYLTEDNDPGQPSGFYRFLPAKPGLAGQSADLLAGGLLQMLAVAQRPRYDTRRGQRVGEELPTAWVDIPEPDPPTAASDTSAVANQGVEGGGAVFARLEGCWWAADGLVYFDATSGGDLELGQIWTYAPGSDRLRLVFESRDPAVLNRPDNICVSPRGGIVVCEDPPHDAYIRALTPDGRIFDFARNILNRREFAGATFSPDGRTLFVNLQGDSAPGGPGYPSMTFAIWGPWERGVL